MTKLQIISHDPRKTVRTFSIRGLIVGILLVWMLFFVLFFFVKGLVDFQKENRSHVVSKELKARMKYHGVQSAFEERGKYYFIRKGKRIKL